ncbi:DUF177 domain-containing protein [Chloroflexota bacterium]
MAKVQINVSQQLKASIGEDRLYEIDGTVDIDSTNINVRGDVRLMRTDRGILVKGIIYSGIELTCGRCLNEFNHNLNLNIEEEYFPVTDVNTGAPVSLPEEPDSFTIDDNNVLDLTDAVCQYALMAIPIKPLCQQNCAGLCPTCGTNLNKVQCECPSAAGDPRWDGLRNMVLTDSNNVIKEKKGSR